MPPVARFHFLELDDQGAVEKIRTRSPGSGMALNTIRDGGRRTLLIMAAVELPGAPALLKIECPQIDSTMSSGDEISLPSPRVPVANV
jgi:hypothetical protein